MNKLEQQEIELLKQQTRLVSDPNKKDKMTRQEANRKIIEKITLIVEQEPDWRFHQILQNIGIEAPGCDQWYDESVETLSDILSSIQ